MLKIQICCGNSEPGSHEHQCNGADKDGYDSCTATWNDQADLPDGWKIARCLCGRVMNAWGDICAPIASVVCPAHTQPAFMKRWGCPNCNRGSEHISLSPASELRDDGRFDPLPTPVPPRTLVVFNGRSVAGILADARRAFPDVADVLVITRDNDDLPPPEGVPSCPVSDFRPAENPTYRPDPEVEYLVVANGGTTAQQAPVLLRLGRARSAVRVFDLQRDGIREILF